MNTPWDGLDKAIDLARSVAADPDNASDSDQLRTVADFLDVDDALHGRTGTEVQDFLRGLALRLEVAS